MLFLIIVLSRIFREFWDFVEEVDEIETGNGDAYHDDTDSAFAYFLYYLFVVAPVALEMIRNFLHLLDYYKQQL